LSVGLARRLALATIGLLLAAGVTFGSSPPLRAEEDEDDFAFGVIVDTTDYRSMRAAREAGFTHAKMVLYWASVEPAPGVYLWNQTKENDYDNILKAARAEEMPLVIRVDGVPGWAGGSPAGADLEAVRDFYEQAARYGEDTVVAFEILNEPNLPFEWGGPPSAAAYTAFLKAAYRGIKKGNPDALVIGGGPSPNTGGFGGTIEDVDFLNGMYDAGAKGFFDIMGVHNYGGNTQPEADPQDCGGICFRRAELYRQLMVDRGDRRTPIWATEWGYLMNPGHNLGQYDWMKVSERQQADYILRAHRYARENWPWLTGSLLSNLDASTSPYHTGPEDGLPWFAILNADYSPRAAFGAFQAYRGPYLARRAAARARPAPAPPAEPAAAPGEEAPPDLAVLPPGEAGAEAAAAPRLRVVRTDGLGLNLRAAPSLSASVLMVAPEGMTLLAYGEPRLAEGRTWQGVLDPNNPTGRSLWGVSDSLEPLE
jgi:hypothetical protein